MKYIKGQQQKDLMNLRPDSLKRQDGKTLDPLQ